MKSKVVKYVFEVDPNSITAKLIHMNNGQHPGSSGLVGGSCLEAGVIHLYCWGDVSSFKNENKFWANLIEHEHIHSLLHENDIHIDFHHEITDRIEKLVE